MALFTTQDLSYSGYSQSIIDSTHPDAIAILQGDYVDKSEEAEVVNFCNQFLEKYKVPKTKASFQKVEHFLHHEALENEIHRSQLQDWIATNWIKLVGISIASTAYNSISITNLLLGAHSKTIFNDSF